MSSAISTAFSILPLSAQASAALAMLAAWSSRWRISARCAFSVASSSCASMTAILFPPPHTLCCAGKSSERRAILWLFRSPSDHLWSANSAPSGLGFLQCTQDSDRIGVHGPCNAQKLDDVEPALAAFVFCDE